MLSPKAMHKRRSNFFPIVQEDRHVCGNNLPAPAFKVRTHYTHVCIVCLSQHSKRGQICVWHIQSEDIFSHTSEHAWYVQREDNVHYPPTPLLWKSGDSAPSHKARTEILTSLCQNVLTLNVKKLILVLALNARTNTSGYFLSTRRHSKSGIPLGCSV